VAYRRPAFEVSSPYNFDEDKHAFIPFIGTSVVRDSQLLLLRLYYRCVCVCVRPRQTSAAWGVGVFALGAKHTRTLTRTRTRTC
jgi:hypothetical protein